MGSSSSRWGQMTDSCESGNEPSRSVQFGRISCLADKIYDPQERLYSMQRVMCVNCTNGGLRTLNCSLQTPTANNVQRQTSPNLATKKQDSIKRANKLSRTHTTMLTLFPSDDGAAVQNWFRTNTSTMFDHQVSNCALRPDPQSTILEHRLKPSATDCRVTSGTPRAAHMTGSVTTVELELKPERRI